MPEQLLIENCRVLSPGERIDANWLLIDGGKIADLGTSSEKKPETAQRLDAGGRLLTPGLIDLHTHGIGPWTYEASADAIHAAAKRPAQYGTTTVLPTLFKMTAGTDLSRLKELTRAISESEGVNFPGFHFEGPFLALPGAGCATLKGDTALLDQLLEATDGKIAAMSISPETENIIPIIERLVKANVVPMVTHTHATALQTQQAIAAGATHATHFLNVFYDPDPPEAGVRAVGPVEAFLADRETTVDLIADGTHVDPLWIRATMAAKRWQNTILITDSMTGAGEPEGLFAVPDGPTVHVSPRGASRIHAPGQESDGWLCGSSLTMDRGVSNLLDWLSDYPAQQVWAMASCNPARLLGLSGKGIIARGADADLVLWDETDEGLKANKTFVAGKQIY
jgi:N-acetylglucosamine-6-phosphate deacetylase